MQCQPNDFLCQLKQTYSNNNFDPNNITNSITPESNKLYNNNIGFNQLNNTNPLENGMNKSFAQKYGDNINLGMGVVNFGLGIDQYLQNRKLLHQNYRLAKEQLRETKEEYNRIKDMRNRISNEYKGR